LKLFGLTRSDDRPGALNVDVARVRLLLIDDDEDEFRLLRSTLGAIRTASYELDWVPSYGAGLERMRSNAYDAYLVDYRLGATSGVELIREARASGCDRPLIMLTGQGAATVDNAALEAGATDFVEKGRSAGPMLERTLRYALSQAEMTGALKRSLRQVSGLEALSRLLSERGPVPDALDEVVRLLDEDFGFERASLYLMERGVLELAAARGYAAPVATIDPRSGRLAPIIQTGRAQTLPNLTVDPMYRSGGDPLELCVPLLAEGECVGILNVAVPEGETLSEDMARPVRMVADRLGVALVLNRAIRGRSYIEPTSLDPRAEREDYLR
jgi:CheY-like chemotaxis protein